MKPKIIDGVKVSKIADHLIKTVYPKNSLINVTLLEQMREVYTEIYGDEDLSKLKLLVIFPGDIDISIDLSERYLNGRVRKKTGEALVANNAKAREYLKGASALMKHNHPVKVFDSEEEALKWLNSL